MHLPRRCKRNAQLEKRRIFSNLLVVTNACYKVLQSTASLEQINEDFLKVFPNLYKSCFSEHRWTISPTLLILNAHDFGCLFPER